MASVGVTSGQPRDDGSSPAGEAVASAAPGGAESSADQAPQRSLRRSPDRGLIGGVCVGAAEYLGVDVAFVRVAMAILVAIGGIGLAVYAIAWALIPLSPKSVGVPRRPRAWREAVLMTVAIAVLLAGVRASGLRFGDTILWPFVLGACGMALVWRPRPAGPGTSAAGRLSLREYLRHPSRIDSPRVIVGVLLVAFAVASILHAMGVLGSLGKAIGAVAVVASVLSLLLAPSLVQLWRNLAFERAGRIREHERAELAAHLHDSVLQTLALIQKRAGDPREVAGLARTQERELRRWLNEGSQRNGDASVAAALAHAAAEVEERHRVPIEVVTVGDGRLDEHTEAIVQAAREAMTNAAKFAGSDHVDLYAEVERDRVHVYVRDRGVGFDVAQIPADRRGVRDSIIGRMQRHGGTAAVNSTPDEGTEVELSVARSGAA